MIFYGLHYISKNPKIFHHFDALFSIFKHSLSESETDILMIICKNKPDVRSWVSVVAYIFRCLPKKNPDFLLFLISNAQNDYIF